MADVRGRRMRTQAPGIDPAAIDPAAAKMWRRVAGEMRAAHTHGATAEMGSAATHTHSAATAAAAAAAKMGAAATAEVSAPATTAEVTAAAADMATASAAAAETAAASGISNRRQTKEKAYCGRARCDFPHDTTSSSGPMREANAGSPGPFRGAEARDAAMHTPP